MSQDIRLFPDLDVVMAYRAWRWLFIGIDVDPTEEWYALTQYLEIPLDDNCHIIRRKQVFGVYPSGTYHFVGLGRNLSAQLTAGCASPDMADLEAVAHGFAAKVGQAFSFERVIMDDDVLNHSEG